MSVAPTDAHEDKTLEHPGTTKVTAVQPSGDDGQDTIIASHGATMPSQKTLPLIPKIDDSLIEVDTTNIGGSAEPGRHASDNIEGQANIDTTSISNEQKTDKPSLVSSTHKLTSLSGQDISHPSLKSASSPIGGQRHRSPSKARSPARSDAGFDEKHSNSDEEHEAESTPEIQNIMDQFVEQAVAPDSEDEKGTTLSPKEIVVPLLDAPAQHPPRKSSLEPLDKTLSHTTYNLESLRSDSISSRTSKDDETGPQVPPKSSPSLSRTIDKSKTHNTETPLSPIATTLHRPPPPEPEPEPDLPFDFHRFLEQLRHRSADPVAKFLRSFLSEFGKKQWMVHEQVKIISDFLVFISSKMAQCEIWREVSDAEFDNAREGMEKLVMNRLYTQTFSPAIPAQKPLLANRSRRRNGEESLGPGRKGQHQEDVERDEVLAQKVSIYGWVQEEHLDIPSVSNSGKRFLILAQQELSKIKTYRAPRDKIICVLNCCKAIFGLLKHSKSDASADSFMPLLIYVILHANPEHMVSNVQYILRFRNQDKLGGEAGYYLSSLSGAVQFIENLDRTTLTVSDEEFEKHVEAAVSAIAEKHQAAPGPESEIKSEESTRDQMSEKQDGSRPGTSIQPSHEGETSTSRKSMSSGDEEDPASLSGMLRTIQRPLSSIGRIFSDDSSRPPRTPEPGHTPRISPSPARQRSRDGMTSARGRYYAEELAPRQASAEIAETQRIERAEHTNVVETLAGMFPDLDKEIISDVVRGKHGDISRSLDACLEIL